MRFGNIESLNSGAAAASGSHEVQKSVRQFANSPLLPLLYGFAGNQFASDAECRRSRQNETDRRLLIHASSGDQWDPRKGPLESANVAVAANLRAWKHLDEIRSGFPRRYDFSGRKGTGYHRQVSLLREFHDFEIESRTGQKGHACVHAEARGLKVQHSSGADNHMRKVFHQMRDHL